MKRYNNDDDAFWRDMLIALKHPQFDDLSTVDALGALYDVRNEQWRQTVRDGLTEHHD